MSSYYSPYDSYRPPGSGDQRKYSPAIPASTHRRHSPERGPPPIPDSVYAALEADLAARSRGREHDRARSASPHRERQSDGRGRSRAREHDHDTRRRVDDQHQRIRSRSPRYLDETETSTRSRTRRRRGGAGRDRRWKQMVPAPPHIDRYVPPDSRFYYDHYDGSKRQRANSDEARRRLGARGETKAQQPGDHLLK